VSDIEATRNHMASTVNAIEERLSPAHLKEQLAGLKEAVVEQLKDAKEQMKEDLTLDFQQAKQAVKEELSEAKVAVKEELTEAKNAVQSELRDARHLVNEEIDHVKTAAYDATVGRVSHMYDDARETVTEASTSFMGAVRANPIPSALIAVGIGWLFMSSRKQAGSRKMRVSRVTQGGSLYGSGAPLYGDGYGPYAGPTEIEATRGELATSRGPRGLLGDGQRAVGRAAQTVGDGASRLGHRAQEGAEGIAQKAGDLAHQVGDGAGRLASSVSSAAGDIVHGAADIAHSAADRAGRIASGVGSTAHDLAHGAVDRAGLIAGEARAAGRSAAQTTRELASDARREVVRAEQSVERAYDINPLAFGAGTLALGIAVGLALPHTRKEDELMGDVKEQLVDRARHAAQDVLHGAEEKMEQVASLASNAQKTVQAYQHVTGNAQPG